MTKTPAAPDLDTLRREIDRIDDAMLDLMVARASVVEKVGAAKRAMGESVGIFLRPGREMDILRRLVHRARGSFPRSVIVRMWREMFSALVAVQGPMSVGVYMPQRGAGFLELARDAYGAYTTMVPFVSAGPVVRAVTDGEVTIGILPMPRQDEPDAWWTTLAVTSEGAPKIVARVPFVGPGVGRGDGVEGLVVARLPQEDTGNDRSLLIIESASDISRTSIRSISEACGLELVEVLASHAVTQDSRQYLVEVSGCVLATDTRVHRLAADPQVSHAVVIGGYAVPFTADDLSY